MEFIFWAIYRGIFQARGKVSIGASVTVARLERGPCKGAKPRHERVTDVMSQGNDSMSEQRI